MFAATNSLTQAPSPAITSHQPSPRSHRGVPRQRCHVLSAALLLGSAAPPFRCDAERPQGAAKDHRNEPVDGRSAKVMESRKSAWLQSWASKYPRARSITFKIEESSNRTYCSCHHFSTFFGGSVATLAPSTPSRDLNDMNSDVKLVSSE